jgi:hypothetical protein
VSPDDHARQLIADSDNWIIEQGKRDGVPVGFTWAQLIRVGDEDSNQQAVDRANGQAFEALLTEWAGADEDGDHWDHVGGYLVVKILDEQGQVTEVGRKATEVMLGLATYAVISDEMFSEIAYEGVERDWEQIESELKGGYLNANGPGQLDLGDGLTDEQIGTLVHEYGQRETETRYDEQGYGTVDRELLADLVSGLGYVVDEDDEPPPPPVDPRQRKLFEDNPTRRPGLSPMLAELENYWGPLPMPSRQEILAYLDAPSLDGWRRIRTKIIAESMRRGTVWQWVRHVDPTFPNADRGGPLAEFPDPFTVARALKAAAEARRRGLT